MFNSLGWPEIALLVVVALFVFGPERLPKMIGDAGRMLRTLRTMANNAREDLKSELGPELGDLDLTSLNPKSFVRKHLMEDDDLFDDGAPQRTPAVQRRLRAGERAPYDVDAT